MAIDPLNWYKASIQATDGNQKEVYLPSRPTAEGAQQTDTTLRVPGMPADAAAVGTELTQIKEDLAAKHRWITVADIEGRLEPIMPTSYDPSTGYFTLENHGFVDKEQISIYLRTETPQSQVVDFVKHLSSFGTLRQNRVSVVDDDTFYITYAWGTSPITGDLKTDVSNICLYRVGESFSINGLGEPKRVKIHVFNSLFLENPYITNESLKNAYMIGGMNIWNFAAGIYAGGLTSHNSYTVTASYEWLIERLDARTVSITGMAKNVFIRNTGSIVTESNDFFGVIASKEQYLSLDSFRYVNIRAVKGTRCMVEAQY